MERLIYQWTYTRQHGAESRRAPRATKNRYSGKAKPAFPLRLHRPARSTVNVAALSRVGRWIVASMLIIISFMVLGKGSGYQAKAADYLAGQWETVKNWSGYQPMRDSEKAAKVRSKPEVKEIPQALAAEVGAVSVAQTNPTAALNPVALISDGGLFCISGEGKVWCPENQTMPDNLPIITGARVEEVPGSMGIYLKTELNMKDARKVLASALLPQLSEIHIEAQGEMVLYTREGTKILAQNGPRLERDLGRLTTVLKDVNRRHQKITLVDLRYEQHVVVRPEPHLKR